MTIKYCANCGSAVEPGDGFCPECGEKIQQVPGAPMATPPTKNKKPISLTAIILAAVLAFMGFCIVRVTLGYKRGEIEAGHRAAVWATGLNRPNKELSAAKTNENIAYAFVFGLPALFLFLRYRKIQKENERE